LLSCMIMPYNSNQSLCWSTLIAKRGALSYLGINNCFGSYRSLVGTQEILNEQVYLKQENNISLTYVVSLTRKSAGQKKTTKERHLGRFRNVLILVLAGIVIFAAVAFSYNWLSAPQHPENLSTVNMNAAAIIDGLGDREPNSPLIQSTVQCLSNSGYTVDVFSGKNVTVDLLENLGGYKIVIMRLHSTTWRGGLYLFSDEEYSIDKYLPEQYSGEVTQAATTDESEIHYFALDSAFLGNLKPDGLKGTTLLLMGCDGVSSSSALQAFRQKGIQTYISWNGFVDLSHSDDATLKLVKAIFSEGLNPKAAVQEVNTEVGPDPIYNSTLVVALT